MYFSIAATKNKATHVHCIIKYQTTRNTGLIKEKLCKDIQGI